MTDTPSTHPDADGPVEMHGPRHHPRHVSGRNRRRLVGGLLVLIALAGVTAGAIMLTGFLPNPTVAGDPKASGHGDAPAAGPQPVKVIRPKGDRDFRITTPRMLASIEPYYQAGLRVRVSGVVRFIAKDIGEPVRAGELLAEIDVPDLQQTVAQKDAVVAQRLREVEGAAADVEGAKATVELGKANVKQKEADVGQAVNLHAFKKKRADRIKVLGDSNSIPPDQVDEARLEALAAESAIESARAAVDKAKAELTDKEASLAKAVADLEIKKSLVEVARKDRAVSAAQLGYARLYAPFHGIVVGRAGDPGRDVTPASEPLITVARVDLVTVVAKVPDHAAPFITPQTEASVEFAQLPGVTVRGTITRYSRYVDPADRTMRVEVDVYNGTQEEYRAMLARCAVEATILPQVPLDPFAAAAAMRLGHLLSRGETKGWQEGRALNPDWGPTGRYTAIVPGTAATMKLDLDRFAHAMMLPVGAVYGKAGQSYILVVEDGVTRDVPVAVQVNDGRLVKVAIQTTVGGRRVTRELTGSEVIVATRQVEIGEGQRVQPVFEKW